jgi:hypothetical protein
MARQAPASTAQSPRPRAVDGARSVGDFAATAGIEVAARGQRPGEERTRGTDFEESRLVGGAGYHARVD